MATQNFHLPNSLTLDSPNVPFEHINTLADATDDALTGLQSDLGNRIATTKMTPTGAGNLTTKTLQSGVTTSLLSTVVSVPTTGVYSITGQMTLIAQAAGAVGIEALQLLVDGAEVARRTTHSQGSNFGAFEIAVHALARRLSAGSHTIELRIITNAQSVTAKAANPQIVIAG